MGFNGLSKKQELFIKLHVVDGLNISDAYREAYDTKTNKQNSLYNQASMLASNPKVAQRIEALKLDISEKIASEVVWNKAKIVSELSINVDLGRETKQLAASNQAIKLIGSAVGNVWEPETMQVNGTLSILHSLSDSVLEKLEALSMPDSVGPTVTVDDTVAIDVDYSVIEPD